MASSDLSTQQELFCAHVASGMYATDAARAAGYSASYSSRLVNLPEIAERIRILREIKRERPPDEIAGKPWIESQLVQIILTAMWPPDKEVVREVPSGAVDLSGKGQVEQVITKIPQDPDLNLARLTLMDLARLRGYIVTKQESTVAKLDLNKLSKKDLGVALAEMLTQLSPGQAEQVRALAAGTVETSAEILEG